MTFRGKTVLVTGGAGPGMGSAIVRSFHREGAHVVAADIDKERLEELRQELPGVVTVEADSATEEGVDRAMEAVGERLDVLCNHAGGSGRVAPLEEVSADEWARVLALNLTGPFLFCKRALPLMLERGGGVITNTASVSGLRGGRGSTAYVAAKFGVVGLTQNIASTYGDQGIRCNAVCPGPTGDRNPLARPNQSDRGRAMLTRDRDKPAPCPPELIANTVLFLATDAAARINGAIIPVDGGWIAY